MLSVNSTPVFASPAVGEPPHRVTSIPRWHFAMLNDHQRNQAFYEAIEATDFSGKTVLDIGTGSGLLAMLIARKGARHVYTCEFNTRVADKAREIIRANGLEQQVTVINKMSTDLLSGVDVPRHIDVMISETVDCGFFGEGFGMALLHAKRELLKPDAEVIPRAVTLNACLLSSQDVVNLNGVHDDIYGLDVSAFNQFKTAGYFPVRLQTWPHQLISDPVEFYSARFEGRVSFDMASEMTFTADANAVAHGVVFWFDLYLKDDNCLSNDPHNSRSHWMQAVQLFDSPVYVRQGQDYQVPFSIDCSGVQFGDSLSTGALRTIAG